MALNTYLLAIGVWVVFDGAVSATIFSKMVDSAKQGTLLWYTDEAVRVVRIIAGSR